MDSHTRVTKALLAFKIQFGTTARLTINHRLHRKADALTLPTGGVIRGRDAVLEQ